MEEACHLHITKHVMSRGGTYLPQNPGQNVIGVDTAAMEKKLVTQIPLSTRPRSAAQSREPNNRHGKVGVSRQE